MQGFYFDPLHGGCLRRVRRVDTDFYRIDGVYGSDEIPRHGYWYAFARFVGPGRLRVDFVGKPTKRPRFLHATYAADGRIRWEDGNVWVPLHVHPRQLACHVT